MFCAAGPAIVPLDEVGDAQAVDIKLWVNGELRPNYSTSDAAHSTAESGGAAQRTSGRGEVWAAATVD